MSEMVERVARAIAERRLRDDQERAVQGGCDIFLVIDGYMPSARIDARAAIEAMREPDRDMVVLGYNSLMDWDARTGEDLGIANIWRAMIDAALT